MCGCGYLNGMCAIFVAQFFTLLGAILSLATMIDCSFATTDQYTFNFKNGLNIESQGVGFIYFEKSDGHCYWYNDTGRDYTENQLQVYWNILGDTWAIATILTWFCAAFSWYFFLYSISFCCSSQIKCCRYLNGFVLSVVLSICQACTFIVYGSEFCNDNGCSFSRGSGVSIGAILCYMIAGMGFFLSSDYPGNDGMNGGDGDDGDEEKHPQGVTNNAVVYQDEDPELTSTEFAKAARISVMLGGSGGSDGLPPSGEISKEAAESSSTSMELRPVVPVAEIETTTNDEQYQQQKPFAPPY